MPERHSSCPQRQSSASTGYPSKQSVVPSSPQFRPSTMFPLFPSSYVKFPQGIALTRSEVTEWELSRQSWAVAPRCG